MSIADEMIDSDLDKLFESDGYKPKKKKKTPRNLWNKSRWSKIRKEKAQKIKEELLKTQKKGDR